MKTAYYEAPHFKVYLDDCLNILAKITEDSVDVIYEIIV